MKFFVGLDVSLTSTGICILRQTGAIHKIGHIESEHITALPNDRMSRIRIIVEKIESFSNMSQSDIGIVALENYSFGSKGKKEALAELGGLVRFSFNLLNIHIIEAAPIQLKKFLLGPQMKLVKGKEAKAIMLKEIYKRYDIDINNDDEGDAFILANIALLYYNIKNNNTPKDLYKYKYEVVDALITKEDKECQKKQKK